MNKTELKQFVKLELQDRWKRWFPTDAELKDVFAWFEPFTTEQAIKAATQVKQEQTTDRWEPDIPKILSICKQMTEVKKTVTHVNCIAVLDDGLMVDFWTPLAGLVELDAERASNIQHGVLRYIVDNRHYANHGLENVAVFVGEENRKYAIELSEQRKAA